MPDLNMELILVYNADSGFFNIIKDGLHKAILPSTYQCNLCALTYGTFRMKEEWRTFIEKLQIPTEFLHKDEFLKRLQSHPHNLKSVEFPAIFLNKGGKVTLFIGRDEINQCKTLVDLMNLISNKVERL
jgi:hypothetical protein